MSNWPFRFVHASDFHLELPAGGVAEVPEHLRQLFLDAAYSAAERVFETVLAEEADFLVLSGDVLDPQQTGPRGPLFLVEQFERLRERGTAVYWVGGRVDPPEAWPSGVALPDNVYRFPAGRVEECVFRRDSTPIARVIGLSRARGRGIRPGDFVADPAGIFSVAAVHGSADPDVLRGRSIHYWALGGNHRRQTLFHSPHIAHYPGTPQGRKPKETGPHGCTVVHVDDQHNIRLTAMATDWLRWQNEQVAIDATTNRGDLERMLDERLRTLKETTPGVDLLICWRIVGSGRLASQLRHGTLAAELLEGLRKRHGFGPPAAWSVSLDAEPPAVLDPEWYEQNTILGDFLREIRRYQMNPSEALDLTPYLPATGASLASLPSTSAHLPESRLGVALGTMLTVSQQPVRERILREAAALGVDLLSGEGPQS